MLSDHPLSWLQVSADPVLRVALYSSAGLILLTVLVMLQVLLISGRAMQRRQLRETFNATWRARFAACSLGTSDSAAFSRPSRDQRVWFLLQWNRFQHQLRGQARERMNVLLRDLNMDAQALRLLQRRSPRAQLVALACLRHLADPSHWDAIVPHLASHNPAIALAAAQTLVAMDAAHAMRLVLGAPQRLNNWAIARLAGLCLQAGPRAVTAPLMAALDQAGADERKRLARLIAYAEPDAARPWARRILAAPAEAQAEELCAALRCVLAAGDPRDRAEALSALEHDHADVRLAAIQAFRRFARLADAPILLTHLADRSWWVRQAAADALVALPGATSEHIARWLDATGDVYGRDALTRAGREARL